LRPATRKFGFVEVYVASRQLGMNRNDTTIVNNPIKVLNRIDTRRIKKAKCEHHHHQKKEMV
jgi:hypothetical protein